jgi:hypothetical protein
MSRSERDLELLGKALVGLDRLFHQCRHVDPGEFEGHFSRFDLLQVEKVVDQVREPPAVLARHVEKGPDLRMDRADLPGIDQVERPLDRRQRACASSWLTTDTNCDLTTSAAFVRSCSTFNSAMWSRFLR